MGRLTLNVLLSFAQFEREVTGERIRDKIAASKRKGMWMGGNLPLGYDPSGRTLTMVGARSRPAPCGPAGCGTPLRHPDAQQLLFASDTRQLGESSNLRF